MTTEPATSLRVVLSGQGEHRESAPREQTDLDFTSLVESFSDMAYGIAFRMLDDVHDAEDAVQDAFLSAYKALPGFKGQSKISTWMYRIVTTTCLMKFRETKKWGKYLSDTAFEDAVIPDWSADPEVSALNGELRGVIGEGLARLAPDLRAPVVLRDIQDLTNAEAAEVLGMSILAFKARLHRGRVQLRKYLQDYLT